MCSNTKIIRMMGGLANRMFQYSLYEYIKTKGYTVFVDNYYKGKLKHETFDWNRIFPNAPLKMASRKWIFLYGGGYDLISKIRRKTKLTFRCYFSPSAFLIPSETEIKSNNYFAGIFQNSKMMKEIEEVIQKKFTFSSFKDDENKFIESEMKACNSVAIHVRKGADYLKRKELGGVCNINYYLEAIRYIKKHVKNPIFYVFTDNPDWVRENFMGINYKLINHNPSVGWGNHFDMQLMSCARHNIIANSTYSWWGAFLNKNQGKIVVAPKQWFGIGYESTELENCAVPDDWIRL